MKIRKGFVSNSSSSSFIVIGNEVGNIFNEDIKLDFQNKEYAMIGKYLNWDEAVDFIHLTPKIYDWLNKRKWNVDTGDGTIIEIIKSNQGAWAEDSMIIPDNVAGAKVWNIKASDNSSKSIKDLEERYITRG